MPAPVMRCVRLQVGAGGVEAIVEVEVDVLGLGVDGDGHGGDGGGEAAVGFVDVLGEGFEVVEDGKGRRKPAAGAESQSKRSGS